MEDELTNQLGKVRRDGGKEVVRCMRLLLSENVCNDPFLLARRG